MDNSEFVGQNKRSKKRARVDGAPSIASSGRKVSKKRKTSVPSNLSSKLSIPSVSSKGSSSKKKRREIIQSKKASNKKVITNEKKSDQEQQEQLQVPSIQIDESVEPAQVDDDEISENLINILIDEHSSSDELGSKEESKGEEKVENSDHEEEKQNDVFEKKDSKNENNSKKKKKTKKKEVSNIPQRRSSRLRVKTETNQEKPDNNEFSFSSAWVLGTKNDGKEEYLSDDEKKTAKKKGSSKSRSSKDKTTKKKASKKYHTLESNVREEVEALEDDTFTSKSNELNTNSYFEASRESIRAVLTKNHELLKKVLNDFKNVHNPFIPRSSNRKFNAMYYAIVNGDIESIKIIFDYAKNIKNREESRVSISSGISSSYTGNQSNQFLGFRVARVNVARKGKEGNDAFLDNIDEFYQGDERLRYNPLHVFTQNLLKAAKRQKIPEEVFEFMKEQTEDMSHNFIYSLRQIALSGQRENLKNILKYIEKRSNYANAGFNFLHYEAIMLDDENAKFSKSFTVPSVTKKSYDFGFNPVHCASINKNTNLLKELLNKSSEAFLSEDQQKTKAIHFASTCESPSNIKYLMSLGCTGREQDSQKRTPLYFAAKSGRTENVKVLVQELEKKFKNQLNNVSEQDENNEMEEEGEVEEVKEEKATSDSEINNMISNILLQKIKKKTILHIAAKRGNIELIEYLVKKGISVSLKDGNSNTPLMLAAERGHFECVEKLIELGAAVYIKDKKGKNALIHATKNGNFEISKYLILNGIDPESCDSSTNHCVHYAAAYGWPNLLKLLVIAGANVAETNDWKVSPLSLAIQQKHFSCADLILENPQCNVNATNLQGNTILLDLLQDKNDHTYNTLKYLLEKKNADVLVEDISGDSPFHFLCKTTHKDDLKIANMLFKHGAKIDLSNEEGQTPFIIALKSANNEMVDFLLEKNANIKSGKPFKSNVLHLILNQVQSKDILSLFKTLVEKLEKRGGYKEIFVDLCEKPDHEGNTPLLSCLKLFNGTSKYNTGNFDPDDKDDELDNNLKNKSEESLDQTEIDDQMELEDEQDEDYVDEELDNPSSGEEEEIIDNKSNKKNVESEEEEEEDESDNENNDVVLNGGTFNAFAKSTNYLNEPNTTSTATGSSTSKLIEFIEYYLEHTKSDQLNNQVFKFEKKKKQEDHNGRGRYRYHYGFNNNNSYPSQSEHYIGFTPLHYAVCKENLELIIYFLKKNVDTNIKDHNGRTPIHYAVSRCLSSINHLSLVSLLVKNGANINIKDRFGRSAFHYVFAPLDGMMNQNVINDPIELLSFILSFDSVDINSIDELQRNVLHYSCMKDNPISTSYLIQKGVDVNAEDIYGNTPICNAIICSKLALAVNLLNKGATVQRDISVLANIYNIKKFNKEGSKTKLQYQNDLTDAVTKKLSVFKYLLKQSYFGMAFSVINNGLNLCEAISDSLSSNNNRIALQLIKNASKTDLLDLNKENQNVFHILAKQNESKVERTFLTKLANILKIKGAKLNLADKYGKTPLHYALISDNEHICRYLVTNKVDPNIKDDQGKTPLMYGCLNSNEKSIISLLTCSLIQVDLNAQDLQKKTALHYVVSPLSIGTYDSIRIVSLLCTHNAKTDIEDIKGRTPMFYACIQKIGNMKYVLKKYNAKELNKKQEEEVEEEYKKLTKEEVNEPVSTKKYNVLEDSKLEAEKIEKEIIEKRKQKIITNSQTSDLVETEDNCLYFDEETDYLYIDGIPKPDNNVNIEHSNVVKEGNFYFSVVLQKTEVQRGTFGFHSFYKLQMVKHKKVSLYIVFTNWGRVGTSGQFQNTPFSSFEDAKKEYTSIFKQKTKNLWEDYIGGNFQKISGKWNVVKYRENSINPSEYLKPFDFSKCKESKLETSVQSLFKMICNVTYTNKSVQDYGLDLNISSIDKSILSESLKVLKKIGETIEEINDLSGDDKIEKFKELSKLSSEFYSMIPMRKYSHSAIPMISTKEDADKNVKTIEDIIDFRITTRILLGAQYRINEINPLDYCFTEIGCNIHSIKEKQDEFVLINKYLKRTLPNHKILDLFKINRQEESERFKKEDDNRKLLWHGSSVTNIISILQNGLRIAPQSAPQSGAMFGRGIYFADTASKSFGYCSAGMSGNVGILLLCEVALGNEKNEIRAKYIEQPEQGYDSTLGMGTNGPQYHEESFFTNDGILVPCGEYKRYTEHKNLSYDKRPTLNNNEYIVYSTDRVKIKYLLRVSN